MDGAENCIRKVTAGHPRSPQTTLSHLLGASAGASRMCGERKTSHRREDDSALEVAPVVCIVVQQQNISDAIHLEREVHARRTVLESV